jgi:hypothetical protein
LSIVPALGHEECFTYLHFLLSSLNTSVSKSEKQLGKALFHPKAGFRRQNSSVRKEIRTSPKQRIQHLPASSPLTCSHFVLLCSSNNTMRNKNDGYAHSVEQTKQNCRFCGSNTVPPEYFLMNKKRQKLTSVWRSPR